MNMLTTALLAVNSADAAAGGPMAMIVSFMPFILILAVFYFMMIRPQRKREKEIQDMRSRLEVGDEVITSGGIIGLVVSIREDSIVLETGNDRSKIRVARWAIQSNNTVHDDVEKAK